MNERTVNSGICFYQCFGVNVSQNNQVHIANDFLLYMLLSSTALSHVDIRKEQYYLTHFISINYKFKDNNDVLILYISISNNYCLFKHLNRIQILQYSAYVTYIMYSIMLTLNVTYTPCSYTISIKSFVRMPNISNYSSCNHYCDFFLSCSFHVLLRNKCKDM